MYGMDQDKKTMCKHQEPGIQITPHLGQESTGQAIKRDSRHSSGLSSLSHYHFHNNHNVAEEVNPKPSQINLG